MIEEKPLDEFRRSYMLQALSSPDRAASLVNTLIKRVEDSFMGGIDLLNLMNHDLLPALQNLHIQLGREVAMEIEEQARRIAEANEQKAPGT